MNNLHSSKNNSASIHQTGYCAVFVLLGVNIDELIVNTVFIGFCCLLSIFYVLASACAIPFCKSVAKRMHDFLIIPTTEDLSTSWEDVKNTEKNIYVEFNPINNTAQGV